MAHAGFGSEGQTLLGQLCNGPRGPAPPMLKKFQAVAEIVCENIHYYYYLFLKLPCQSYANWDKNTMFH